MYIQDTILKLWMCVSKLDLGGEGAHRPNSKPSRLSTDNLSQWHFIHHSYTLKPELTGRACEVNTSWRSPEGIVRVINVKLYQSIRVIRHENKWKCVKLTRSCVFLSSSSSLDKLSFHGAPRWICPRTRFPRAFSRRRSWVCGTFFSFFHRDGRRARKWRHVIGGAQLDQSPPHARTHTHTHTLVKYKPPTCFFINCFYFLLLMFKVILLQLWPLLSNIISLSK